MRGQVNGESRSLSNFGLKVDGAFAFLDEPMDDGQTQTGAFVGRLGCKKRLKYFWDDIRRNAGTVVLDGNGQERRDVVKTLAINELAFRTVVKLRPVCERGGRR